MTRRWLRTAETMGLRIATRPAGVAGQGLRALTRASDGAGLWLATAAVVALAGGPRGRRAAVQGVAAIGVTSALANGPAKLLVRRRRPGRLATAGLRRAGRAPATSSFPSGHTASAFAFAAAAGLEVPALGAPLAGTAALVGWSRLHGAQHFPTDVVAGAVLGTAVGVVTHSVWRRLSGPPSPPGDAAAADEGAADLAAPAAADQAYLVVPSA